MNGWLGSVAFAATLAFWLYTARKVSVDKRLSPQARHVGSLAVFFGPPVALLYWLPQFGGGMPFWLDPPTEPDASEHDTQT